MYYILYLNGVVTIYRNYIVMLEFCEKIRFIKPKNGFEIYDSHHKGQIHKRIRSVKNDDGIEIIDFKNSSYEQIFNEALLVDSIGKVLEFFNKHGVYLNTFENINELITSGNDNRIQEMSVLSFLTTISRINELIDLFAAKNSNDLNLLKGYFEISLSEISYKRIYQSDWLNSGIISDKSRLGEVWKKIKIPKNIADDFDYQKGLDFIIHHLLDDSLRRSINITLTISGGGLRYKFLPASFNQFLHLYFADSLNTGTRYQICEICGNSFGVRLKPGRTPKYCSDACKQRKFRSTRNERTS